MAWLAAIIGGVAQGAGSYMAGQEQSEAAAEAQRNQQQYTEQQQKALQDWAAQAASGYTSDEANNPIFGSALHNYTQGTLRDSAAGARGALASGESDALRALNRSANSAQAGFAGARDSGQASILGGLQGAEGALGDTLALRRHAAGATNSIGAYDVTGQSSRLADMLSRGDALAERLDRGTNLDDDAGYRFRQKQGEDAISRAASARGGRLSGRTLQELGEFNQGMASQEYAAADARRRSTDQSLASLYGQQAGMAGGVDQLGQAALFNQAGRSDAASMQAQANMMSLAGLGYGAAGDIAGMRNAAGMSLADLFGTNARDAANVNAALSGQMAGVSTGTASQMAGIDQSLGSQLANATLGMQTNYTNSLLGVGSQSAGLAAGAQGGFMAGVPYAGAGTAGIANAGGQTAQNLAALYQMDQNKGGG